MKNDKPDLGSNLPGQAIRIGGRRLAAAAILTFWGAFPLPGTARCSVAQTRLGVGQILLHGLLAHAISLKVRLLPAFAPAFLLVLWVSAARRMREWNPVLVRMARVTVHASCRHDVAPPKLEGRQAISPRVRWWVCALVQPAPQPQCLAAFSDGRRPVSLPCDRLLAE